MKFKRNSMWLLAAGLLVGAIAGFLYWKEIGCVTGSCPITSNPWISTMYGGVLGGLFAGMFRKKNNPPASSGKQMNE